MAFPTEGQMVGGFYVRPSPWAGAFNALAQSAQQGAQRAQRQAQQGQSLEQALRVLGAPAGVGTGIAGAPQAVQPAMVQGTLAEMKGPKAQNPPTNYLWNQPGNPEAGVHAIPGGEKDTAAMVQQLQSDPQGFDLMAINILEGRPVPLGRNSSGPAVAMRAALYQRAAELAVQQGIKTPTAMAAVRTQVAADSKALEQNQKRIVATAGSEEAVNRNFNQIRQLSQSVFRVGSPLLDQYNLLVQGHVMGNKQTLALQALIGTTADEAAKVVTGSLGSSAATDAARREYRDKLNAALSNGTLDYVMQQLSQEMANRVASYRDQTQQIQNRLQTFEGYTAQPAAPAAPPSVGYAAPSAGYTPAPSAGYTPAPQGAPTAPTAPAAPAAPTSVDDLLKKYQ